MCHSWTLATMCRRVFYSRWPRFLGEQQQFVGLTAGPKNYGPSYGCSIQNIESNRPYDGRIKESLM